jgi:RND family efflux transporter MFP subunit
MNYRGGIVTGAAGALVLVAAAWLAWAILLRPPPKAKSAGTVTPAKVERIAKEGEFNTITLTDDHERALRIQTATVEEKRVQRSRLLGGEVVLPPGQTVIVSAPLAGALKAPGRGMPRPGQSVKKGQTVALLVPILTPEAKATLANAAVEAEGQVNSASTQVDAARIALTRAEKLFEGKAGSQRNVDEAKEKHDLALKALEAATARRDLLKRVVGDLDKGGPAALPIKAPEPGVIKSVSALPGQAVPGGAALFEVVRLSPVWVRVGAYVGDLPELAPDGKAEVGGLADGPGRPTRPAYPVKAPPSANPLAGSVDLFYELDNTDGHYRPGQRVGVSLPLKDDVRKDNKAPLVVPWSAVVLDVQGGTWVYVSMGKRTYARHRVRVARVVDNQAVLTDGPPAGTKVVTHGTQELFGTEVGFAK